MIAKKMRASLLKSAQLTLFADAEATRLHQCRDELKQAGRLASIEDLVNLAFIKMLMDHPRLNGQSTSDIVTYSPEVNLSIAIDIPQGLVAPAIIKAQALSLDELSSARRDLVERARAGKLSVEEMTAGTATVSNLGKTRVTHFTPIINAPQIVILGASRVEAAPWVIEEGVVEARQKIGLSLTFDHRIVDGAPAAAAFSDLIKSIETITLDGQCASSADPKFDTNSLGN